MGVYGPFTAVAGTVQECDVDPNATGLYFINKSIYDLYLAFLPTKPAAVTSFGGGYWYYKVPTGDRRGVRIPLGVYGGAGFPGYLFVLPVDESGQLALSGATSNNALFNIESYEDASAMPPDYASAQFQNITSQPRTIALPLGMLQWATGQWTVAATDLQTQSFSIPAALLSASLPTINLYFYYALFSLSDTTAGHNADLQLAAQFLHGGSGGTRLGSLFPIARFVIGSTATGAPQLVEINPRNPFCYQAAGVGIPATSDTVAIYLHEASGGTGFGIDYTIAAALDLTNVTAIGTIGNAQIQHAGSATGASW